MKQIRFLHTADWHGDSDTKKQVKLEASLKQIVEYCKDNPVNAIIHAGDVWERSQKYEFNSGVPIVLKYLHELAKLVDFIFITKGNNSHDEPGSISLLHQIEPNIYAYEYPVVLSVCEDSSMQIVDILREGEFREPDYIVSLVPYPTKASLISEDSIDNNNAAFIEKFEQIFEHIGEVTKEYICPKILAFHGNVVGSRLSSGQTLVSQDIMVAPATLQKAMHHYYALGHIHIRQEVFMNGVYSGSIYNKNWGETEQKSFEVIKITQYPDKSDPTFELYKQTIPLTSARPMIKLECKFNEGEFDFADPGYALEIGMKGYEYRIRVEVKENERNLITEDKLVNLKFLYGEDVKIEYNIIPVERESRSERIMHCRSLVDEVCEYAVVVGEPVHNGFLSKVAKLQEDVR